MNKSVILILLYILNSDFTYPQSSYSNSGIYFGAGTSVSSYLGGYFGNAYAMRVLSSGSYYYDNYNNNYNSYNYNSSTIWSPFQFSAVLGKNINDFLSIEAESDFIFHFNGRVDPQFTSGTSGNRNYLDRNDYASLFAIPVSVCFKLSGGFGNGSAAYLKIGPAFQYTSESYEKIREYYSDDDHGYYSYDIYMGSVSKQQWLPGFKTGIGLEYFISDFSYMVTELEYSYFNIDRTNNTALALDSAPEAQLFSLTTKVFFQF